MAEFIGKQLGNYRLIRWLDRGGFAEVHLGQHVHLACKQAAIKILHLIDVDVKKIQEEAETTEKLLHPHIVRLLDLALEQATPFLVLDDAPGGSHRARHPERSSLSLARVGEYLKDLAPALQYAHDQHLFYRDMKPDHLLMGRTGGGTLAFRLWHGCFGTNWADLVLISPALFYHFYQPSNRQRKSI
jgi:serine/threonine protein kinase